MTPTRLKSILFHFARGTVEVYLIFINKLLYYHFADLVETQKGNKYASKKSR